MKFTNISKATEVVVETAKTISPALKPSASDVFDINIVNGKPTVGESYNPIKTALEDAATGAVAVKIPVYRRAQYVTLNEGEVFEVTPASDAEAEFYRNVAKVFDSKTVEFVDDEEETTEE